MSEQTDTPMDGILPSAVYWKQQAEAERTRADTAVQGRAAIVAANDELSDRVVAAERLAAERARLVERLRTIIENSAHACVTENCAHCTWLGYRMGLLDGGSDTPEEAAATASPVPDDCWCTQAPHTHTQATGAPDARDAVVQAAREWVGATNEVNKWSRHQPIPTKIVDRMSEARWALRRAVEDIDRAPQEPAASPSGEQS